MKIIKPSVQFFGAVPTDYAGALAFIETAGRTCYKSEDKITADSAEGFVKRLIKAGHLAMVEHSNFVVRLYCRSEKEALAACVGLPPSRYLKVEIIPEVGSIFVGGNITAWFHAALAEGPADIFEPFCEVYGELFGHRLTEIGISPWEVCPRNEIPAALHRYSAKFICDRGVSHELVRHRPCSFAQESTRYVNYGGKDMEFIEPTDYELWAQIQADNFEYLCQESENIYKYLLDTGLSPQQARAVLPNALKTEIIVTADAAEWSHIKKLRTHPSAHQDMVRVMNMMPWEEMGL